MLFSITSEGSAFTDIKEGSMYHWVLALRELFTFSSVSWKSRWIAAAIRFAQIKQLRWGSAETVRRVVDNNTVLFVRSRDQ